MRALVRAKIGALVAAVAATFVAAGSAARDPNLAAALATVHRQCPQAEAQISTGVWMAGWAFNALYGNCNAGDGHDQHVWFFGGGRLLGMDTREPDSSKAIVAMWRDDRTIAFLYVLYRRSDPLCCPTGGGTIVRFRIAGDHVAALDKLPPRELGSVAVGR